MVDKTVLQGRGIMKNKHLFLPTASNCFTKDLLTDSKGNTGQEVRGNAPCPCCGCITIPNHGDALAYICPVCLWEIDLFIHTENESSDQNHGLTLLQARENYKKFGAVLPGLKRYCREPREDELSDIGK